jgi:hypothetical protein
MTEALHNDYQDMTTSGLKNQPLTEARGFDVQ